MTMSPLNAELAKQDPKPQRKIGWSSQNHRHTHTHTHIFAK